jgi:hypothetical protein
MELEVREGGVETLRATVALTALVPAGSIYGERVPDDRTFPFIRTVVPSSIPFRMSCHNGEQSTVRISAFTKGPSMNAAADVSRVIRDELDGKPLLIGGEPSVMVWDGSTVIPDPDEPDGWHSISEFTVF